MNKFLDQFETYNLDLFEKGVRLPEIQITNEDRLSIGAAENCSNADYLKKLAWKGCLELMAKGKITQTKQECIDRLKMEFDVFSSTGTIDYILLLLDIFLWCEKNDILRGPARGSAGAAFSLFCLGLNKINPLDFPDLNFTRFLSEARVRPKYVDGVLFADGKNMCDFDGDVQYFGRDRLIQRLLSDYEGRVCKILTIQYLTAKTAIKDTVKSMLEYSESEALELGFHIESLFGKVDSLEKTYEKNESFRKWADESLSSYKTALKIEGLQRSVGVHASGIAISYYPIKDILPEELCSTGERVSGMDMSKVLTVSVKCDVLGLRQLDLMKIVLDKVGLKMDDLNPHDESIYRYLDSSSQYYGLFQIEAGLTKEATLKIKPKKLEHIVATLAISRPGSYKHIDEFASYVNTGQRKLIYPAIDDILESTGSILLYQEQINSICQKVYGLSPTEADDVRRCIGKKDVEGMKKWEPIIKDNGAKLNVPEDVTGWFFQIVKDSADYLFNASHAASYALITAYTTYLKANFPLEFFYACLEVSKIEADPIEAITKTQNEMSKTSIHLLPPSLLRSNESFEIENGNIRMGLAGIRGVSEKALEKLKVFSYSDSNRLELFESFENSKLPIGVTKPLILAGCLDDENSPVSRSKLLLSLELFKLLTPREKPLVFNLGPKYNYDIFLIVKALATELKNEKGKPHISESRFATIKKKILPFKTKYLENVKNEKLSNIIFEQELLGFNYSAQLIEVYNPVVKNLLQIADGQKLPEKSPFMCVAFVDELELREQRAGKKSKYLVLTLRDETSKMKAYVWGINNIENVRKANGRDVKKGDVVICKCSRKHERDSYVNNLVIQDCPTIMKVKKVEENN